MSYNKVFIFSAGAIIGYIAISYIVDKFLYNLSDLRYNIRA